jgi:Na+/H+-dicarboxylate symporter
MKSTLHKRIFIGMGIGLVAGLVLHNVADPASSFFMTTAWWLNLLGRDLFVGALKMIIVPLIFASIVAGICSLPNPKNLGSLGWKTFTYYFSTTAIAVAIGLVAVLVIRPGYKDGSAALKADRETRYGGYKEDVLKSFGAETPDEAILHQAWLEEISRREGGQADSGSFKSKWTRMQTAEQPAEMFRQNIIKPILANPVEAMATMNTLGIIFFAVLTGLACMVIGEPAKPVADFFKAFNEVVMKITLWVMEVAPLAIGCIIAQVLMELGVDAIKALGWYCLTVVVGIGLHVIVLLAIVSVFGNMSPVTFLKGIRNAWLIAFASTSSAATLPVTMRCVNEELKVDSKVSNFSLPVGATMNMDGTALYEGVAIIFMIQVFGFMPDVNLVLTPMTTFIIFITAVLASVGAAAVPSAGLVTMALVASAVGLPIYYIVIIYSVDHLLDMFRTSTNVMGDAVGAVVVDRWTQHERAEK